MRWQYLAALLAAVAVPTVAFPSEAAAQSRPPAYKNFRAAIYITVADTKRLAGPATFQRQFARASSQLHFDKVYIEAYRDRVFATDAELAAVKRQFHAKGIETSGGITLAAGGSGGQFGTFDYELPADRAEAEQAVRRIARHFDEIILDDFFFYTSKSDADIAAKGNRSWTDYRVDTMRKASRNLVLGPAKQENPRVRVIIKYPNWYEHFHGLGYDLAEQAKMFDAIYTGTETRDPVITDQLLQQYESYEVYRYLSNVRPGANLGGWVDTFDTRSIDRYAEQLWDTMFAKAPEIMLFNWHPMAEDAPATAGDRAWANDATSFDWDTIAREHPNAGWATAANAALHAADAVVEQLGNPVGVASYRPPHATGEDFLHNYIGNLGVPVELSPQYPVDAQTILLTRAAATDPAIIAKAKASLQGGARVIVTSGFVEATQGKGFEDLAEWQVTGHPIAINQYFDGFGAGRGKELKETGKAKPVLFPEVRFYTNDSWGIIRGVASAKGFPIVLMNQYSKGTLFLWTVPENFGDLYELPRPMVTRIKEYLFPDAAVRLDAPDHVALFTYDNGAFIVENYRDEPAEVTISLSGSPSVSAITQNANIATVSEKGRSRFSVAIPAHSFRVFKSGQ
ncbi:hypothetical protein LZ016_10030 [Sphingomonas sp. SM33]|uniref:Uncharacterized protein n=1 Tax=Sphingomonas telluris TaxID=2907998 RepID=A0ABS9VN85_9SPHN|nr:hypothetical protein [Sphingomonas telluris]MCH8616436.1 hypothetical protein [Sphingomonas telluris]